MVDRFSDFKKNNSVVCYSIRRINPFLGVLQVIESSAGRATSSNGVVWDIELLGPMGDEWGSLSENEELAYSQYGLWSLEDGLVNHPLFSQLNDDSLVEQGEKLIESISEKIQQLPFELIDKKELWLFDSSDTRPIALLSTTISESVFASPDPKYWSGCVGMKGVPSQYRYPFVKELELQVKALAGFNIYKHWVERLEDGSGLTDSKKHRTILKNEFPVFLITEDWPEKEQQSLVESYIEWIAPSLLTLQNLSLNLRSRLEKSLHVQAVSIEHHWNLYPEIIDHVVMKAARVQCQLQNK